MKTTIGILVAAVIILTGAVGVVIYQKTSYDKQLQTAMQETLQAKSDLAQQQAMLSDTQKLLAEANAKPAPAPLIVPVIITGENGIYVGDQPAGSTVNVTVALLAKPGYIVIHKEADGQPAAVIGVSGLLAAGRIDNLAVTLQEPMVANAKYFAMLHTDDGSGAYSTVIEDKPVLDTAGKVVQIEFNTFTSGQLPPTSAPQTSPAPTGSMPIINAPVPTEPTNTPNPY